MEQLSGEVAEAPRDPRRREEAQTGTDHPGLRSAIEGVVECMGNGMEEPGMTRLVPAWRGAPSTMPSLPDELLVTLKGFAETRTPSF